MIHEKYYYFSTHTLNESVYGRLESNHEFSLLSDDIKETLTKFVSLYPKKGESKVSPMDYCSLFMINHKDELHDLIADLGTQSTKYFLSRYLGYSLKWGASTLSFGKSSSKRAEEISEEELIEEMTSEKGTIKKLLNSAHSDLTAVKPFLPAIMISLDTNTRNKELMEFTHTGRFCFDFDAFKDSKEALKWMEIIWKGTTNIKPYMAFLSPRGKGFKVFCRVDKTDEEFKRDYISGDREVIMKHHKVWYEGAKVEILKKHPSLIDNFDDATKDPQRLTYIPFIKDKSINFKYEKDRISSYSKITAAQKKKDRNELLKKISKNSSAVEKIMREQGIKSKEDAYHLYLKSRQDNFDLELETEKFIQVIDFLEDLMMSDNRVSNWVYENFNDYSTLHKMSWVLFGVFGEIAIDNLKRLVPSGSNKLDESHNDYRWAVRSKDDYDDDQLNSITPGAFYALVQQLGEVKDFLAENFRLSSKSVSELKLLNGYYDTYEKNRDLSNDEATANKADLSEFLDEITNHVDSKKIRLPLIEELDSLTSEVKLGPSEYLDKKTMTNLYQVKYSDKKIFCLRSQCGTGKNTVAGNPDYKLKGRVILAEPFKSISDQAASEAWENGDREEQLFVNSGVEDTLKSFKKKDSEAIKVNYETSLRGATLPSSDELVIHCTYNQILNISFDDLETIDYIFVDECHTLSDGLTYRSGVIASLIHYLVEFVAKKRNSKTKIIFMSGTPNVETHVIPELMAEYNVKDLYQRIIVDKSYKIRPTIDLTHLDTLDTSERENTVIGKIKSYIKQGRKVCHIFNNKSKMDMFVREIQSKLSSKVKVGLFYSGSTGECTRNILGGKFGDYDVVLATTYFINGINIEKDNLTEKELEDGVTSRQKYGVVIDLGQNHTRVNAMDAIQAINRFRNRLCHSTIYLPKIFKPDLNDPTKVFNFQSAAKTLLGINKYNYHLLSTQEDMEAIDTGPEEVPKEKLLLLEELRRNPLYISSTDITKATKDEENRAKVFTMITKKARLYEDWFCSLDGYHYLAKDAGFRSIIKHNSKIVNLNPFDSNQIDIENRIVTKFFSDDKMLEYLDEQLDPERRIHLKSSGRITDPDSEEVSNFKVTDLLNDKYVVEGDFHESHERLLNKLIRIHLNFTYWYGLELTSDIIKLILDPKVVLLSNPNKHLGISMVTYQKSCKASRPLKFLNTYTYLYSLLKLSKIDNSGVSLKQLDTSSKFTLESIAVSETLRSVWAEFLYEGTVKKIKSSESTDKDDLLDYFSKKDLMREYDISDLKESLKELGTYKSYRRSRKEPYSMTSPEYLELSRVVVSDKLKRGSKLLDTAEWAEPETFSKRDLKKSIDSIESEKLKRLSGKLKDVAKIDPTYEACLKAEVEKRYISGVTTETELVNFLEKELTDSKLDIRITDSISSMLYTLSYKDDLYMSIFKNAEYELYRECKLTSRMSSLDKLFFMDPDYDIETLRPVDVSSTTVPDADIEAALKVHLEDKRIRKGDHVYKIAVYEGEVLFVNSEKKTFLKDLLTHAFNNKGFILPTGIPDKVWNSNIYNISTFQRGYLDSPDPDKQILNYKIITKVYTGKYLREILKK